MLRRWRAWFEGRFWQATRPMRRRIRAKKREFAGLIWRFRDEGSKPRPEPGFRLSGSAWRRRPLVLLVRPAKGFDGDSWRSGLATQSLKSWILDREPDQEADWILEVPQRPPGVLPVAQLEAMLMVGELEGLSWVLDESLDWMAVRTGRPSSIAAPVLGKRFSLPPAVSSLESRREPWAGSETHCVAASRDYDEFEVAVSGDSPAADIAGNSNTGSMALLLAPFLAVGGAERLLLEYIDRTENAGRLLVATTERHRVELGERLSDVHFSVPVFPLGDILSRDLLLEAISNLIRTHDVGSLVAWNGCNFFYDSVPELRERFPRLRIVNQFFDHRTGWIRRLTPDLVRAIDIQIAVNQPIAEELTAVVGVLPARVRTVLHGVAADAGGRRGDRQALRDDLSVADEALLVVTFARMHEQKRPLDIVRVAGRFRPEECRFLIVGGGPLGERVEREIESRELAHVRLIPFERDPSRWLDAADLCLLTSRHEGVPLFLLEGMVRGLPFVATAVGGIPALGESGAGDVVPVGDIDGMEIAIRKMMSKPRRDEMGRRAIVAAESDFGVHRFVREMDTAIFGDEFP